MNVSTIIDEPTITPEHLSVIPESDDLIHTEPVVKRDPSSAPSKVEYSGGQDDDAFEGLLSQFQKLWQDQTRRTRDEQSEVAKLRQRVETSESTMQEMQSSMDGKVQESVAAAEEFWAERLELLRTEQAASINQIQSLSGQIVELRALNDHWEGIINQARSVVNAESPSKRRRTED